MKKGWNALSVVAVVIWTGTARAETVDLAFLPSSQIMGTGSPVSVTLRISGLGSFSAPSLGAYDLTVGFDPASLALNGVIFGDPGLGDQLDLFGLGNIQLLTPGSDYINLFELSLDSATDLEDLQSGQFTLATITFDTVAASTTSLTLTVNALADANGESLLAPEVGTADVLRRTGGFLLDIYSISNPLHFSRAVMSCGAGSHCG